MKITRENLKIMMNEAVYYGNFKEIVRLKKIADMNNINLKRDDNL